MYDIDLQELFRESHEPLPVTKMSGNLVGSVGQFDPKLEGWECYFERFGQFILINDIAEDKQVPCLLAMIGPVTYNLLRNLLHPTKPGDKPLVDIDTAMTEHFTAKRIVIAERFRFYAAHQKEGEAVSSYVARLKDLAKFCNFDTTLTDMLRDKFVCGLRNGSLQQKLLANDKLTFALAQQMALNDECARKEVAQLQGKTVESRFTAVHALGSKPKPTAKSTPSNEGRGFDKKCSHCGRKNHAAKDCKFRTAICHKCDQKGHIAPICPTKGKSSDSAVHQMSELYLSSDEDDFEDGACGGVTIYSMKSQQEDDEPFYVTVQVGGQQLRMEIDTGSGKSVIGKKLYDKYFADYKLHSMELLLYTYTKETIHPLGYIIVPVQYGVRTKNLRLYVVSFNAPALFGRAWCNSFGIKMSQVKSISSSGPGSGLQELLSRYQDVFDSELGTMKDIYARFKVKPESKPVFCKARPVSFTRKAQISKRLLELETKGIIEKVDHSEWAAPIVTPVKSDGSIRLCGDFKVTINPHLSIDQYPLPKIEEIFANIGNGTRFSKLDLKNAYLQMEVCPEDQKYLTVNTHQGLYRYKRLVYGVASAPAIWQRSMDQVLQGLSGTQCYLDDIVVTGRDDAEHLANLTAVLGRLQKFGLRLNEQKCEFMKASVQYCGHIISKDGLHMVSDKTAAVLNSPAPENQDQLRAWLGFISYYRKFLPNLASVLGPVNKLLRNDVPWEWGKDQQSAFHKVKKLLASDRVLVHYDPTKELVVSCDASSYGLGCVISHVIDGQERPLAFASRTLTDPEKKLFPIGKRGIGLSLGSEKIPLLPGRPVLYPSD